MKSMKALMDALQGIILWYSLLPEPGLVPNAAGFSALMRGARRAYNLAADEVVMAGVAESQARAHEQLFGEARRLREALGGEWSVVDEVVPNPSATVAAITNGTLTLGIIESKDGHDLFAICRALNAARRK